MNNELLRGLLVPALTPFRPDLAPDHQGFVGHCRWLLQQGADGLAVFGTTSEANSLSLEERMDLLDALVDGGVSPVNLLPGTGTCALPDSVRLTQHAVDHGCAGVLMLPPFYYKGVSDEGLFSFFAQVIDKVGEGDLKIYLYHIPPVSGVGFSLELIERMCSTYPTVVVGIKDSGGDWTYTQSLLKAFPQLSIFPGSEIFLLDGLRLGGAGCITASGNVNAAAIQAVLNRWREPEADRLQSDISRIRKIIQSHPMIPALKVILAEHLGQPGWLRIRPPLSPLGDAASSKLLRDLRQLGFNIAAPSAVVSR